VRNGPVSSRVALLLRSAEGKPSFASISPIQAALVANCVGVMGDGRTPELWRLVCLLGSGCRVASLTFSLKEGMREMQSLR
jgi:hypothetical protein